MGLLPQVQDLVFRSYLPLSRILLQNQIILTSIQHLLLREFYKQLALKNQNATPQIQMVIPLSFSNVFFTFPCSLSFFKTSISCNNESIFLLCMN